MLQETELLLLTSHSALTDQPQKQLQTNVH